MLIPGPRATTELDGRFLLAGATRIVLGNNAPEARNVAAYLQARLQPATGFPLDISQEASERDIVLTLSGDSASPGSEAYQLRVESNGVRLSASTAAGLFMGVQTLCQLLPSEIESQERVEREEGWSIQGVEIDDEPAFKWRGMLLDCSRHFMSKAFIKRTLDVLARLRMNRFHWHITDDQGWRLEIRKYPELTRLGGFVMNEATQQGYYSQDDIKEIVAYAADRHIMVVPEIDVPGHSFAAVKSYPWLCCTGRPVRQASGHTRDLYCAGKERTFEFMEDVLSETMELFPAPFIHIGGDEAPKNNWRECPACQERIRKEGLKDEEELQAYFNRRIADFLQKNGRRLVGWDEIVEGGAPKSSLVQFWRHRTTQNKFCIDAVRKGYEVVASPNSFCYLSFPVTPDEHFRVERTSTLKKVYGAKYLPQELSPEEHQRIIGAECCIWSEYLTEHDVYRMLFPRVLAVSELMWSYPKARDYDQFVKRVQACQARWQLAGVDFGPAE